MLPVSGGTPLTRTLKLLCIGAALLLVAPLSLHAQDGCDDSPENPTVVLAIVGSAGACFSIARTRLKARRANSK